MPLTPLRSLGTLLAAHSSPSTLSACLESCCSPRPPDCPCAAMGCAQSGSHRRAGSCYSAGQKRVASASIDTPAAGWWWTSLLRPGTFLVCWAFTRQTSRPCCSRTSNTGIQYTPVDCMDTLCTPFSTSQRPPQIGGKTSETPHGLRVALRADGHPMLAAAHVAPGRIRVHDFQCLPVHFLLDGPLSLEIINTWRCGGYRFWHYTCVQETLHAPGF